ncbi:hypothetical protein [Mesorhizobium muleiense]|uniref:hypothetical protein n=1 Tax=Mesorhizobium muleiense TaxID=1004279 RepID=UPI001F484182|nr:hypothetical protein [Mesorhizobium muleiense]
MLGKAYFRSWPFEVRFTVCIWLLALFYSIGLWLWLVTFGLPKVPEFVIVPAMVVFALSALVFMQLSCYRAFGLGVLATFGNMLDPEFRRNIRRRMMWSVSDRKPPL